MLRRLNKQDDNQIIIIIQSLIIHLDEVHDPTIVEDVGDEEDEEDEVDEEVWDMAVNNIKSNY